MSVRSAQEARAQMRTYAVRKELTEEVYRLRRLGYVLPERFYRAWNSGYDAATMLMEMPVNLIAILNTLDDIEKGN